MPGSVRSRESARNACWVPAGDDCAGLHPPYVYTRSRTVVGWLESRPKRAILTLDPVATVTAYPKGVGWTHDGAGNPPEGGLPLPEPCH